MKARPLSRAFSIRMPAVVELKHQAFRRIIGDTHNFRAAKPGQHHPRGLVVASGRAGNHWRIDHRDAGVIDSSGDVVMNAGEHIQITGSRVRKITKIRDTHELENFLH